MNKSACFTGHRNVTENEMELFERLHILLEKMVNEQDLTDFYSGGAVGFDAAASLTVLKLRERYPQIRLHLVLPCSNEEQTEDWSEEQKLEFRHILKLADTVEYTSEHKDKNSMKKRNARLVELASEYCICFWKQSRRRSGTGQTVRMAQKKGLDIINLFEI